MTSLTTELVLNFDNQHLKSRSKYSKFVSSLYWIGCSPAKKKIKL